MVVPLGRAPGLGVCLLVLLGACSGGTLEPVDPQDGGTNGAPRDGGSGDPDAQAGPDTPPTLRITLPTDGSMVEADTLRIEGEAQDERAVRNVFVRVGPNVPLRAHTDDNYKHFWIESPVPQGAFEVSARATDSSGQQSEPAVVRLEAPTTGSDDEAPTIEITAPPDGSTPAQALALVTGTTSDDRGVVSIEVELNGEPIEERAVETDDFFATWARLVPLSPGAANEITFIARDALGNEASATLTLQGPVETDKEAPTLIIDSPADGAMLAEASVDVAGTATDDVGVREVKARAGQTPSGASEPEWQEYMACSTEDGFANWRCDGLPLPSGAVQVEVKAIDLNGLASTATLNLQNAFVSEWTEEVAVPLRLREEGDRPVLTLRLDREGVNEVISADIQRDTRLLELETNALLAEALEQIKNSCGTLWQQDNEDPRHDCEAAFGSSWRSSPEYSVVRILTMTPANVVVDGTSIEGIKDVADALNVGGGFREILSDTLGIGRTDEIVGTDALVFSLQNFFMADHPAVLPGAKLPVTLYDAMNDLRPMSQTLGPQGGHPGIVDPSFEVQSQVLGDDFEMVLGAQSNLSWKDGVDVAGASTNATKDYIAVVQDETGPTFEDVLEFDFSDPDRFDIVGLSPSPTVDLRFRLQEAPTFVPACTEGRDPCLGNTPSTPVAGYVWERPRYESETVIAAGALEQYRDRDDYSQTYYTLGFIEAAEVTVGAGDDPAGWTTFETFLDLGDPPPPQYTWELILEVAQVALHDLGDAEIDEGEANAAFTLHEVPVGLTADQIRASIRDELQGQRQKLSEQLLGDFEGNNGPVDFYYDRGADGEPYVFFVAESDPLPTDSYDYMTPGFFSDAALMTKVSTREAGTSGDSTHEKLSLSPGETTVFMRDEIGDVHRLRFVVPEDPSEIQVFVSRRAD